MKTNAQSKVLAINFGGIGDEILFLPTLKSIRKAVPGCHLTLLLEPRSRSVEQISPLIDSVVTFDIKKRPLYIADLVQVVRLIRDGGYDIVVSSGSSKLVSILLFLGGSERRIGYDSGALSHSLLTDPVPLNREQYAAMMYHDLASGLGVEPLPPKECVPEIVVPSHNLERMQEFLNRESVHKTSALQAQASAAPEQGTAYDGTLRRVILHPGTSKLAIQKGIIKTWRIDCWVQLIRSLSSETDMEILLAGGPDDEEIISAIMKDVAKDAPLRNCYGKTRDLADLAALIQFSDVLVCVDSAPMHIGVGLQKPLVALFGPTEPKKLVPQDPRFRVLRGNPTASEARLLPRGEPGVQLQPGIVLRSVMDQLKASTGRGSSREPAR